MLLASQLRIHTLVILGCASIAYRRLADTPELKPFYQRLMLSL
jgi:hypothetical protein